MVTSIREEENRENPNGEYLQAKENGKCPPSPGRILLDHYIIMEALRQETAHLSQLFECPLAL